MRVASRSLLEERARKRLEAEPEVRFLTGLEASDLVLDAEGNVIVGVRTRRLSSAEEIITADLVVDASGQGSLAPRWLEGLGYEASGEEVVDARLGCATRWVGVPEDFSGAGRAWPSCRAGRIIPEARHAPPG